MWSSSPQARFDAVAQLCIGAGQLSTLSLLRVPAAICRLLALGEACRRKLLSRCIHELDKHRKFGNVCVRAVALLMSTT